MKTIGICFVEREDWLDYCKISGALHCDDSDYDAHVSKIDRFCEEMASKGRSVIKIPVKPADLSEWCKSHDLEADSIGRSQYVTERLATMGNSQDS